MVTAVAEEIDLRKQFEEAKQRSCAGLQIFEAAVALTKPVNVESFNHNVRKMKSAIESYLSAAEQSK